MDLIKETNDNLVSECDLEVYDDNVRKAEIIEKIRKLNGEIEELHKELSTLERG